MKYGESTFDIVYLLFAIVLGVCILRKRRDAVGGLMGAAVPVAVAASLVPMLGMLMLPKTVCYMLLVWAFWKYASEEIPS